MSDFRERSTTDTLIALVHKPFRQPAWYRSQFFIRHRRPLLLLIILVLLCSLLIGIIVLWPNAASPYRLLPPALGNLQVTAHGSGTLQSVIYDASFSVGGNVATILVTVGQNVKVGDTLAKLDPAPLQDSVTQNQAKVDASQTSLTNATTNLSNMNIQTQAQVTLAADQQQSAIAACQNVSHCIQQANDQYNAALALANQQVAAAQANVAESQAQLTLAQSQLQRAQHQLTATVLLAPHSGVIMSINGNLGSPTGGAALPPFIQIADITAFQVVANIDESAIAAIHLGNQATITMKSHGTLFLHGQVSAVSPISHVANGSVSYPVTLTLNQSDLQGISLLDGMAADVSIIIAYRPAVLLIPNLAITYAQQAAKRGSPISARQGAAALTQASTLQGTLLAQHPDLADDHPGLAYVVQRTKEHYGVMPIITGLSDGQYTEVLAGLTIQDKVVVGEGLVQVPPLSTPVSTPTPTPTPNAG